MNHRNREEGWKYAKISGHKNEEKIGNLLNDNEDFFLKLAFRLDKENITGKVKIGGLNETNYESVLDNKTKSKTDMKISFVDNTKINISIKKSLGGQVFLIKTSRFIKGFEIQFNTEIPKKVKKAMMLFWGEDPNIEKAIRNFGEKNDESIKKYENRKKRLVAESLKRFDYSLYKEMLKWFKNNIDKITLFCFSTGLIKNKNEWADYIWYKNNVDGNNNIDYLFKISDIIKKCCQNLDKIEYGERGGGTTIQLPFGFVQWHQESMQFHHKYEKINAL